MGGLHFLKSRRNDLKVWGRAAVLGLSLLASACSWNSEESDVVAEKGLATLGAACGGANPPCGPCTVCDVGGTCVADNANLPVDGDVCTDDVCTAGVPSNPFNTGPCDDGNACTTATTCGAVTPGVCGGGTPVDPDDGNPCTDDSCDPALGVQNTDNAAPCGDGNVCNGAEVCGGGTCNPGTPPVVSDGNLCTDDSCDPVLGVQHTNNTAPCGDGNACNGAEVCGGGTCNSGTPLVVDDGNPCTDDSCDPGTGTITHADNTNACDDGDACTTGDVCGGGTCGGTPITCTQSANVCLETNGACVAGVCTFTPVANDSPCTDGNACTGATGTPDRCVAGSCVAGTATACSQSANACRETVGTCDPGDGSCDFAARPNGTACGTGPSPTTCGTSQACVAGTCTSSTPPMGTSCSDGNACTGASGTPDACNGAGACVPGSATVCGTPPNDQCWNPTGSCNTTNGVCSYTPRAANFPCDDPVVNTGPNRDCTQSDTCNGSGTCVPGTRNVGLCPTAPCAVATCDSSLGCGLDASLASGNVCRASGGVCDAVESCDGVSTACPVDAKVNSGSVCQNASCANATQVNQGTCDGTTNACNFAPNVACSPYQCAATTCGTTCASDGDCLPAFYCSLPGGTCEPRVGVGAPCASSAECDTTVPNCVDGVCCNAPCSGQCEACNVTGAEGTCSPVTGAPVGTRPACATDGTACGGTCGGANRSACTYPGTSTQCLGASCDGATNRATPVSTCNSAGTCITPPSLDCAPYVCAGTTCRTDCTSDAQCEAGLQCASGVCIDKYPPGTACTAATQCQSGFCVDGVCCSSACGGQCEACNVAGQAGTCTPVEGAPVAPRAACAGSGACGGSCDGRGRSGCAYPGAETSCRAAECSDDVATLGATCSGNGSCPASATVECPDGCDGVVCANPECRVDADCEGDEVCRAGICGPPGGPGTACGGASDCASGFCVDGVCCDAACEGQCEACDVSGAAGTCSPVPAGELPHGARPTCSSDGSSCGGTCDGTERTSCGYPTSSCRPGSCAGGAAVDEASCGGGACPAARAVDCGAFGCTADGLRCDGPCATDPSACGADEFCAAGLCLPKLPDGSACADVDECSSGFCVDGVCCNTACTEQCATCDGAGTAGVCSPITGGARGGRPGCQGQGACGSACDGEDLDACVFPGADVVCGEASCMLGVVTARASCDGRGRCGTGEQTACSTLVCSGAECGAACETDEECPGEAVCDGGVCEERVVLNAVDKGSCACRAVGGPEGATSSGARMAALAFVGLALGLRRRLRPRAV